MKFRGNSDATKLPLRLVYFAGIHPDNASKLADVYFGVSNLVWLFISILVLVELARSENLETALEPWQSFMIMIQCVLEALPARCHKGTLKTIIEETRNFWRIENVSERVEKECLDLLKLADSFCRNWFYYLAAMSFSYNLAPAFLGGLPYPCYVPGDHRLLIYAIQLYATATIIVTLTGLGVIFVSICAEIVVQYRLLEYEFETFGNSSNSRSEEFDGKIEETNVDKSFKLTRSGKNYRELVDHHNFLFEYCEQLRKYGNEIFVLKVVITTVAMCVHLYITLLGNFSPLNKIKSGLFFASQMFDFTLFCGVAELVSSASMSAGNAAYSSDWPSNRAPETRKAVVMVLARAQKQFNFVGQGLVVMNLRTLTQVFKTALSFQAYLRTMVSAKEAN